MRLEQLSRSNTIHLLHIGAAGEVNVFNTTLFLLCAALDVSFFYTDVSPSHLLLRVQHWSQNCGFTENVLHKAATAHVLWFLNNECRTPASEGATEHVIIPACPPENAPRWVKRTSRINCSHKESLKRHSQRQSPTMNLNLQTRFQWQNVRSRYL